MIRCPECHGEMVQIWKCRACGYRSDRTPSQTDSPPMDGGTPTPRTDKFYSNDKTNEFAEDASFAGTLERELAAMTEKMRGWAEAAGTATARNIQLERELFDVKADRYYSDRHRKAADERLRYSESERADAVRRYEAAEVRANDLSIELREAVGMVGGLLAKLSEALDALAYDLDSRTLMIKADAWLAKQEGGGG